MTAAPFLTACLAGAWAVTFWAVTVLRHARRAFEDGGE